MPRINPAIRRPPLMTSSMAYSSATRIGLSSGMRLPRIATLARVVRCATIEPIRLQFGIRLNGL
jgi:hypothetical protein